MPNCVRCHHPASAHGEINQDGRIIGPETSCRDYLSPLTPDDTRVPASSPPPDVPEVVYPIEVERID